MRLLTPHFLAKKSLIYSMGVQWFFEKRVQRRIWLDRLNKRPTLLIHQMGKVGSSSILASLNNAKLNRTWSIYGTHFLSVTGTRFLKELEKKGYGSWDKFTPNVKSMVTRDAVVSRAFLKRQFFGRPLKVITLVRDPIATNVAGFFQNNDWWPDKLKEACHSANNACLDMVFARFISHYPHDVPITWFDMEIKGVFGIDVYERPFPHEKGYQIYRHDQVELLLIKLEMLNKCAPEALKTYLNVPNFYLVNANNAKNKWYQHLYSDFKKSIIFSDDYLQKMYKSKFASQFYTPKELHAFIGKWSHQ